MSMKITGITHREVEVIRPLITCPRCNVTFVSNVLLPPPPPEVHVIDLWCCELCGHFSTDKVSVCDCSPASKTPFTHFKATLTEVMK